MFWLVFIYFFVANYCVGVAEKIVDNCFEPHYHKAYTGAVPIVELWNLSVSDCFIYCVDTTPECAGVVYHKNFRTCQLYRKENPDNSNIVLVFAYGHDYYKKISSEDNCNSSKAKQNKEATNPFKVVAHGIKTEKSEEVIFQENLPALTEAVTEMMNEPTTESTTTTTTTIIPQTITQQLIEDKKAEILDPMNAPEEEKLVEDSISEVLFFNPSSKKLLSSEFKTAFFKMEGFKTSNSNVKTKKTIDISEGECLSFCSKNINFHSKKSYCQDIIYNTEKRSCFLHNENIKEFGKFTRLTEASHTNYLEKFSMPFNAPCEKEVPIFKIHNSKKAVGNFLKEIKDVHHIKDCATLCIVDGMCGIATYSNKTCTLHHHFYDGKKQTFESLIVNAESSSVVIENGCK